MRKDERSVVIRPSQGLHVPTHPRIQGARKFEKEDKGRD
jgi:hypothetical protein